MNYVEPVFTNEIIKLTADCCIILFNKELKIKK